MKNKTVFRIASLALMTWSQIASSELNASEYQRSEKIRSEINSQCRKNKTEIGAYQKELSGLQLKRLATDYRRLMIQRYKEKYEKEIAKVENLYLEIDESLKKSKDSFDINGANLEKGLTEEIGFAEAVIWEQLLKHLDENQWLIPQPSFVKDYFRNKNPKVITVVRTDTGAVGAARLVPAKVALDLLYVKYPVLKQRSLDSLPVDFGKHLVAPTFGDAAVSYFRKPFECKWTQDNRECIVGKILLKANPEPKDYQAYISKKPAVFLGPKDFEKSYSEAMVGFNKVFTGDPKSYGSHILGYAFNAYSFYAYHTELLNQDIPKIIRKLAADTGFRNQLRNQTRRQWMQWEENQEGLNRAIYNEGNQLIDSQLYLLESELSVSLIKNKEFKDWAIEQKKVWSVYCSNQFGNNWRQIASKSLKATSLVVMVGTVAAGPLLGPIAPVALPYLIGTSAGAQVLAHLLRAFEKKIEWDFVDAAFPGSPAAIMSYRSKVASEVGLGFLYAGLTWGGIEKVTGFTVNGQKVGLYGLLKAQIEDSSSRILLLANIIIPTVANAKSYLDSEVNPLSRPRFYAAIAQDTITGIVMADPTITGKIKEGIAGLEFLKVAKNVGLGSVYSAGAAFLISNHAENIINFQPHEKNDPISTNYEIGYAFSGGSTILRGGYYFAAFFGEMAASKAVGAEATKGLIKLVGGSAVAETILGILIMLPYDYMYADFYAQSRVAYIENSSFQHWPFGVIDSYREISWLKPVLSAFNLKKDLPEEEK